jgi:hypothetical protein
MTVFPLEGEIAGGEFSDIGWGAGRRSAKNDFKVSVLSKGVKGVI